jgi:elongator complex protein 1
MQGKELIEIVGSIDAGISAAAWSPDEELLTITTLADTLLLMSRDIENIASITLATEDVNVSSVTGSNGTGIHRRRSTECLR